MGFSFIPIWKEAPFIRLVIPFIIGIISGYFLPPDAAAWWKGLGVSIIAICIFSRLALSVQFRRAFVRGIFINCLFICFGALLTVCHDTSDVPGAVSASFPDHPVIFASLEEPVSEKPRSYKALCRIDAIRDSNHLRDPATNIIIYFRKDSTASPPGYGDRIAFIRTPERITDIPGAGSFDYVAYCARQNIYFRVFLKPGEFVTLPGRKTDWLPDLLFSTQAWVIGVLRKNIPGKKECGLAEALLIGYRNDLDRQLIQSYSNTGVVHVVAISGLHLGLIYGLLKCCCLPLGKKKAGKWMSALVIIVGLWLFSLLAGGGPSVLRSAVMFSFIVLGEAIGRKTSLFNNLAASAFFLLCIDPYWLWDIGFQLSYAALISIAVFMKPVYHVISFRNGILDTVWQLNAVTIAAQILTTPVCMYYFHQFPALFLITNFIAVPLSSVILMGEIALCALSYVTILAAPVGRGLWHALKFMNDMIETLGSLGFSSIKEIEISIFQTVMMYIFICCTSTWLLAGKRPGLPLALVAAILFMAEKLI